MADNKIMEEIFKTIDIITSHKIYSTEYVYTEDCVVVSKTNDSFTYRILHENQEYEAYAPLGEYYKVGESVVVLFTDYSRISKKIILYGDPKNSNFVRKLSPTAFSNSASIIADTYVSNGITYGSDVPRLVFGIDPSALPPNTTSYSNLLSTISILNPVLNNESYYYSPIKFRSYFYDEYGSANSITQIPEYLVIGTDNNLSYAPIYDRRNAAVFNSFGNIQFFNTSNHVLDIGVGNSSYSLTRYFYNDGTGQQLIGSVGMSGMGVSYNTTSDYRLKEDIVEIENGLDKINNLRPISWTWKNTSISSEGFLAHEVQEVIPVAVIGEKDKYDYDGNPKYQQIDLTRIIPTLVSAVKELSLEISLLKEEIKNLKQGDAINGS